MTRVHGHTVSDHLKSDHYMIQIVRMSVDLMILNLYNAGRGYLWYLVALS